MKHPGFDTNKSEKYIDRMTSSLESQLRQKYPDILDTVDLPFNIGDGWFKLIDDLCCKLSEEIKKDWSTMQRHSNQSKTRKLKVLLF